MNLAEVREANAPAEVRRLYDDIKQATGIPQVNLIYRHLATEQGMLEWTWAVLGPLYRSGAITAQVGRLTAAIADISDSAPLSGLAPDEALAVRDVLAFYNHGNAHNLIAFATLGKADTDLTTNARGPDVSIASARRPAPPSAIAPLPRLTALPEDMQALVTDLAGRQGGAAIGVTPSMYLHLALWPAAMRVVHATVLEMIETGRLADDVARVTARVDDIAGELVGLLAAPDVAAPEPGRRQAALTTIKTFVDHTIPEMVVIGHWLARRF